MSFNFACFSSKSVILILKTLTFSVHQPNSSVEFWIWFFYFYYQGFLLESENLHLELKYLVIFKNSINFGWALTFIYFFSIIYWTISYCFKLINSLNLFYIMFWQFLNQSSIGIFESYNKVRTAKISIIFS